MAPKSLVYHPAVQYVLVNLADCSVTISQVHSMRNTWLDLAEDHSYDTTLSSSSYGHRILESLW